MYKKEFRSKIATTKCGYCNTKIKEENLENHCKTVHRKPKLAAGQSTLESLFKPKERADETTGDELQDDQPPDINQPAPKKCKVSDSVDEDSEPNAELNNNIFLSDEFNVENYIGVEGIIDKENTEGNAPYDTSSDFATVPAKIDELTKTVNAIKASVDKIQANTQAPTDSAVAVVTGTDDNLLSDEHLAYLTLCKSIDDILRYFPELSYDETEQLLKCDLCCQNPRKGGSLPGLFMYEKDVDDKDTDRKNFKYLKSHLKRHLANKTHVENHEAKNKTEDDERKFQIRCKQVGLRIARLCYDGYKSGSSARAFENEVMKAVLNDIDLGDLNHSKNFPDKFRRYVATEVKRRTSAFLSQRLPQTGFLPPINVQADKGTTVHTTRQFTTVTTITPGSESLISVIYLGQPVVKNHTGEGIANSIIEELEKYGIERSQVEGGSYDGQYFHLKVPDHLVNKFGLPSQFFCTWDPLHKIGVVETHIRKDEAFAWLVKLTEICQQIYKKFNWGKNYEALVEMCEQLEMKMRNLKTFSTTRFPNSVRAVFDTLIDDFPAVVKCLEGIANNEDTGAEAHKKAADAEAISRKILSKSFILQLSGTADIYENFGHVANLAQVVDNLPYERYDNVMNAVDHFDTMSRCLDHKQCIELYEGGDDKVFKCLWPRYHECRESLKSDKFRGVDIKNEHEKKAYYTKLTKKHDELGLSTRADEITAAKLEELVKRLSNDLRNETFEESTIECIDTIRKICDVKTFAVQVKKYGAVQSSHRLGAEFLKASRQVTGTLDDISDVEIRENFAKFLKVIEAKTKDRDESKLDSKSLIKLLLSEHDLYSGVELTLHCIVTAAVKISVESVVESLVSRYETHFDKKRQLKEIHALEEMEIAENGPELVHADKILTKAMSEYWAENSVDGKWHFCHKSNDIRTYSNNSKVVQKLLNTKPKFPFMKD